MKISEIFIYPIKSLGGISVKTALVKERGLELDRRMMLVDMEGNFITKREFHTLEFLDCKFSNGNIVVYDRRDFNNTIDIPYASDSKNEVSVRVWNDDLIARRTLNDFDDFFSNFLSFKCMLVIISDSSNRTIGNLEGIATGQVGFADAYPYLIISQASLADLNSKLEKPVAMNRFRPNVVVAGSRAYEEDSFSEFYAGTAGFRVIRPSSRCIMTTIDPLSGLPGKEPLKTLNTYRRHGHDVIFGANAIASKTGIINIDDQLHFLD